MGKRKVLHYKKHLLYDKTFQPIVSAINVHDHSPIICCEEKRKGRVIELQYKYSWVSLLILKYGFRPFRLPGLLRNGPQTTKEISETPFLTWPSWWHHNGISGNCLFTEIWVEKQNAIVWWKIKQYCLDIKFRYCEEKSCIQSDRNVNPSFWRMKRLKPFFLFLTAVLGAL